MKIPILFVDDELSILSGIKRKLAKEPYYVYTASSGKEALAILKKEDIDIMVTDMLMPEMNGLQLLEQVNKLYPRILRIILSGYTEVPSILQALNSNLIFRFITKPWRMDGDGLSVLKDAANYARIISPENHSAFVFSEKRFHVLAAAMGKPFIIANSEQEIVQTSKEYQHILHHHFEISSAKELLLEQENVNFILTPQQIFGSNNGQYLYLL